MKSNLDRKKFAHSPIQFLQTAQEIDRLGHILYSFHRFDLKRFVSRLQTLIDLLQPEQTWKGRDEIYSDRFENSLWPCARLVITHYIIRVFRKLCAHDCASHRPLFIGRRSVWPAVHTPNVSQWTVSNLVIRWRVIVFDVFKKKGIFSLPYLGIRSQIVLLCRNKFSLALDQWTMDNIYYWSKSRNE